MSETIVAQATPSGESALAIIRISGDLCVKLCEQCFKKTETAPRRNRLSNYYDINGQVIDQVIYCYYEEKKSFTGEEMIEITCHGNMLITKAIVEDLILKGAILAEPGEFSKRAFLNGKIDLIQAESIAELISAKNLSALRIARRNLLGKFSSKIEKLQSRLIDLQANMEAFIDFPEDDIGEESKQIYLNQLNELINEFQSLLDACERNINLNKVYRVVLMGIPNAGKSSLFNFLIGYQRAIVSTKPGTTRDYVSQNIILADFEIEIIDTAGVHKDGGEIETEGINNTIKLLKDSDLILLVLDSSLPYPTELNEVISKNIKKDNLLIIENKIDLKYGINSSEYPSNQGVIKMSTVEEVGLNELVSEISNYFNNGQNEADELDFSVNIRHRDCIDNSLKFCKNAHDILVQNIDYLLVISEIKQAITSIGEIIGKTDNENMLDKLFSNFCIGK